MVEIDELKLLIRDSESISRKKEEERLAVLKSRLTGGLCLWGAGVNGRKWATILSGMGLEFYLVDRDKNVWGTAVEGSIVNTWDDIKDKVDTVLVSSSKFYKEVKDEVGAAYDVVDMQSLTAGNYRNRNLRIQGLTNIDNKLEKVMRDFYDEISNEDYLANAEMAASHLPIHLLFYLSEITQLTLNRCEPKICHESNYYRHQDVILKYAGMDELPSYELPPVRIFHGEMFHKQDCKLLEGNYVCFGTNMKQEIRKVYPKALVFPIGAYIHYSEPFYDNDKFLEYKRKLKRNLLVFPQKSIEHYDVHFDEDEFISYVLNEAKSFDSFSVCARAEDMDRRYVKAFKAAGGNIVCAGLRFDKNYLPRQKTMIDASDAVLTNSIGTHITYALAQKRPVKFYRQGSKKILSSGAEFVEKTDDKLMSVLEASDYHLTPEILDTYEPFLGMKFWRSPEEIRTYYELCSEIWETAGYVISHLEEAGQKVETQLKEGASNMESIKLRILQEALN